MWQSGKLQTLQSEGTGTKWSVCKAWVTSLLVSLGFLICKVGTILGNSQPSQGFPAWGLAHGRPQEIAVIVMFEGWLGAFSHVLHLILFSQPPLPEQDKAGVEATCSL